VFIHASSLLFPQIVENVLKVCNAFSHVTDSGRRARKVFDKDVEIPHPDN
jgi:hypothetical protein